MTTRTSRINSKENFQNNYILHRYLSEKCNRIDFAPLCGMNDYQQISKKCNVINAGSNLSPPTTTQASTFSLKRPLSSTNTSNTYLNNDALNENNEKQIDVKKNSINKYELNDETLRNNVQIVLKNLNQNYCNALIKGAKNVFCDETAMSITPEADCNSNPTTAATVFPFFSNTMLPIGCSIASSQDFTHDNSDYQWFLDYGYRDAMQQPQSVLSSLSASYSGIGELSYYEDLAKNIDANLAEVDMESFRTEDIHSLLTTLPTKSASKAEKLSLNDLDNSICKSELLFSPVKESHISIDSLDMEGFADEQDIILTCKANKDNYTIAFEGSAMYSDESFYDGPEYSQGTKLKQNSINLKNKLLTTPVPTDITALDISLSRSETGAYTTWSKLRQSSTALTSQENDHAETCEPKPIRRHLPHCFVNKSTSMPNLKAILNNQNASNAISNSSMDSYGNQRALLPHYPMPVSQTSENENPNVTMHQSNEESQEQANNVPSFNLVKLFIKQKSSSTDTCMDVSSGCWPSDSSGSDHANNNNNNNGNNGGLRARKKSMNDSGKGSDRLSRHDEEFDEDEERYDSLDPTPISQTKTMNTAVNSPQKQANTHIKDLHLNIRNQLKHPALYNLYKMNNSLNNNNNNNNNNVLTTGDSDTSRTSENLTQIFNINKSRETMTKSIQTSMTNSNIKDSVRVVPPSFLAKIQSEIKKENAPVFIVYPNYALPDLEFVKAAQPQVILSPIGYKEMPKKRRPVSLGDMDAIKNRAYNHVTDWKSLCTLLPPEYRKLLKSIPEAQEQCMDASITAQKPIFSMTPPIRQNKGIACDCAYFLSNQCSSSDGSSSQPPSSGYRGSSTLLTDSEMGGGGANSGGGDTSNLYVYNYETEVPAERPPSGRPKGILRRANTSRNSASRSKRSSLIESNEEKRRSLQEPFSINEYISEMDENEARFIQQNLLPNYPKQRETYEDFRLHCNNKQEIEARLRAEQFLINVPKSELRHYAEIANILESEPPAYNSFQLRNEVSRALSSQRRVNFSSSKPPVTASPSKLRSCVNQRLLKPNELRFTTPPNSPNMSVMNAKKVSPTQTKTPSPKGDVEKEKEEKIQKNRFKRLQIQWELLSKEASERETKSGGTTPTSAQKSRIPRPVSYPTAKMPTSDKNLKSPSRIVPPKRYSIVPAPTPIPRTPCKTSPSAHTSAKKTVSRAPVNRTR